MNQQPPKLLQTIIFIGRSGAGKGTQSLLLLDFLQKQIGGGSIYVETGKYFRELITHDDLTAQLAKDIYMNGERHPDFLATNLWSNALRTEYTGAEHIVFDGAPRSRLEAEMIEGAFWFYDRYNISRYAKPIVLFLDVSAKWSQERLKSRGRVDEMRQDQIDSRTHYFETEVVPAIQYLKENSKFRFIHINGEQTIEEVHTAILKEITDY